MKQVDYTEIILPTITEFFSEMRGEGEYRYIFQEDNDGYHRTNNIYGQQRGSFDNPYNIFKLDHRIKQLRPYWPPNSPDLSLIERV